MICKLNPTSDLVKKQLSQLRDQWQTLKQTAANQTRALGGAKNLQEFNRKVDKLEAWIKEKVKQTFLSCSVAMLSGRSGFNCRRDHFLIILVVFQQFVHFIYFILFIAGSVI